MGSARQLQERDLTTARQAWLMAPPGSLLTAGFWHICCREPRMAALGLRAKDDDLSRRLKIVMWHHAMMFALRLLLPGICAGIGPTTESQRHARDHKRTC